MVDNGVLEADADLAEIASDQIAKLVLAKYKGGRFAHLVKAILTVQGYDVYMPPEGPDKWQNHGSFPVRIFLLSL